MTRQTGNFPLDSSSLPASFSAYLHFSPTSDSLLDKHSRDRLSRRNPTTLLLLNCTTPNKSRQQRVCNCNFISFVDLSTRCHPLEERERRGDCVQYLLSININSTCDVWAKLLLRELWQFIITIIRGNDLLFFSSVQIFNKIGRFYPERNASKRDF